MGHIAALPEHLPLTFDKPILTFIVPAPHGCNLRCPYCYIARRGEHATKTDLSPRNYRAFIEQIAEQEQIGAICIQGYEPLLAESFPYTREILEVGRRLGVPTSLVTNGTRLACHAEDLAELRPDKIAVSLDAADPAVHDRSRRRPGAFEATVAGLRAAADKPLLQPALVIASILMPQKHRRLIGVAAIAAGLNIGHWVVTVLQSVGKEAIGKAVGDRRRTFRDLLLLKRDAERHGIHFVVDDEFGSLGENDVDRDSINVNALRVRRFVQPAGTFRLLPTGQCSMGLDILKEVRPETPRWDVDHMNAWDFIQTMRNRQRATSALG